MIYKVQWQYLDQRRVHTYSTNVQSMERALEHGIFLAAFLDERQRPVDVWIVADNGNILPLELAL